jgi:hypothetical protein
MLKSMVTGMKVPSPPGVLEAYGEVMSGYTEPRADHAPRASNSLTAKP